MTEPLDLTDDPFDLLAVGGRPPGGDPALQALGDLRQALDAVAARPAAAPAGPGPSGPRWGHRTATLAVVGALTLSLSGVAAAVGGPGQLLRPVQRGIEVLRGNDGDAAGAGRLLDRADELLAQARRAGWLGQPGRSQLRDLLDRARRLAPADDQMLLRRAAGLEGALLSLPTAPPPPSPSVREGASTAGPDAARPPGPARPAAPEPAPGEAPDSSGPRRAPEPSAGPEPDATDREGRPAPGPAAGSRGGSPAPAESPGPEPDSSPEPQPSPDGDPGDGG